MRRKGSLSRAVISVWGNKEGVLGSSCFTMLSLLDVMQTGAKALA